jgi:hypothetical protein
MALLIKSTEESKIYLRNTDIVLDEIYTRIQFTAHPNGMSIEACLSYYQTKQKYLENKYLPIDMDANYYFDISDLEEQSLSIVHNYVRDIFVSKGYLVDILPL